jgi:hypothetical protein
MTIVRMDDVNYDSRANFNFDSIFYLSFFGKPFDLSYFTLNLAASFILFFS